MRVCVLGSLNQDVVARVGRLPRPGETVPGLGVALLPGGKGANQAVAAARFGAAVSLLGAVGDDAAGRMVLEALAADGVDVSGVQALPDRPTGQAFITVAADGENCIVVAPGANAHPGQHALAEGVFAADVVLCQLETPVAAVEAWLRNPRLDARLRILNTAPALPDAARLFPLFDVLVLNEGELAAYAGDARALLTRPGQAVVVTLGSRGCMAVTAEAEFALPSRPARVVDTTGAGDCFCGVLAAALAEGQDLRAAMTLANAAASLAVERPGACAAMPTRAEVAAASA